MTVSLPLRIPSPMQTIELSLTNGSIIPIGIKRDDLIDKNISGNKWRKLQPNLSAMKESGKSTILTTGGAFSNHLAAVARACNLLGIKVIGLVRSGVLDGGNPTIRYCLDQGMEIRRIDRQWSDEDSIGLAFREGAYWLPEGGSNDLGVEGIGTLAKEIMSEAIPDAIFVSVGSGGTLAGLRTFLPRSVRIYAVSSFDTSSMQKMMTERYRVDLANVIWVQQFSGTGFGKYDDALVSYAKSFYERFRIPLDPLYTVKTAMAMEDMLVEGSISPNTKVVMIHSGGLQGWLGYQYRFPNKDFPDFVRAPAH